MKMKMDNYKPKISARNKKFADKVRELTSKYKIIGVVEVTGLPAQQFQEIRSKLKGKAEVLIVKKNIAKLVLNELDKDKAKGVSGLEGSLKGVCGLIFTNENPFKLFKFVQSNKSSAPAKPGQVSPRDIIVKAGPTSFAPGPIIGELGSLKIKAGIEGGKVAIKEDAVVAKEGDVISAKLAEILTRLDIKPMEVGLDIKAIYEGGLVYRKDVLSVDEGFYIEQLKAAARESYSLSIGLRYITCENILYFLSKGSKEAFALASGIGYLCEETVGAVLLKIYLEAVALAKVLPADLVPSELSSVNNNIAASVGNDGKKDESEEVKRSDDKKEEGSEEGVAAGLGSLFG